MNEIEQLVEAAKQLNDFDLKAVERGIREEMYKREISGHEPSLGDDFDDEDDEGYDDDYYDDDFDDCYDDDWDWDDYESDDDDWDDDL